MLTLPSSPAASSFLHLRGGARLEHPQRRYPPAQDGPQGALQAIPRPRYQDQAHLPGVVAQYDIKKLADALDPTADLDFDYLGVQTLYDRYLIVDKTGDKPRRLETPQFFWMRVSMGLFVPKRKTARLGDPSLQPLQRPPFLLSTPYPLQLRHPPLPAFLLLPLQGGRLH